MVPDFVVTVFAIVMVVSLAVVTWTLIQAWLTHRAVKDDPELRRFAGVKLLREGILWIAQASLAVVFSLAASFMPPRPPVVASIIILGLLSMSAAIALLSWHDYLELHIAFDNNNSEEGGTRMNVQTLVWVILAIILVVVLVRLLG